ncbi:41494_t:CDS:1, partial [Gigaspora margarita]
TNVKTNKKPSVNSTKNDESTKKYKKNDKNKKPTELLIQREIYL